MKNHRITTAWDRIEPDASADERMLSAILEKNHSRPREKSFRVLLVSLALILAAVGITVSRMPKTYTAALENGDSIVYRKGSTGESSFDIGYAVSSRELTDPELDAVFPAGTEARSAIGLFRDETGELLRVEGTVKDAKIILARTGFPVNDVVLAGTAAPSTVSGIPVEAGYYVTDPNSRGEQTIIFFASFSIGNTDAYVECAGEKQNGDAVSQETSDLIYRIISEGGPDFSAVSY